MRFLIDNALSPDVAEHLRLQGTPLTRRLAALGASLIESSPRSQPL